MDKQEYEPIVYKIQEYICPVHGDIGEHFIRSTIPGYEMNLCWRCALEKLVELGVSKVVEKPNE